MDIPMTIDEELAALDLAKFPHRDHVRLAFHMLERVPFGAAVMRFSNGLQLLTEKLGKPDVYHETVTVAFLAVIGERRAQMGSGVNWREFILANPDLLEKGCLQRWYSADELGSDFARRTFVLPRRRADGDSTAPTSGRLEPKTTTESDRSPGTDPYPS